MFQCCNQLLWRVSGDRDRKGGRVVGPAEVEGCQPAAKGLGRANRLREREGEQELQKEGRVGWKPAGGERISQLQRGGRLLVAGETKRQPG